MNDYIVECPARFLERDHTRFGDVATYVKASSSEKALELGMEWLRFQDAFEIVGKGTVRLFPIPCDCAYINEEGALVGG